MSVNDDEEEMEDISCYAQKLERETNHCVTVKVPLRSLIFKNGARFEGSQLFFNQINNIIVYKWNTIKPNIQNFSNYYLNYVLEQHQQLTIPLLNKEFFLLLSNICTYPEYKPYNSKKSKKIITPEITNEIKQVHKEYMAFLKIKSPSYHNMLLRDGGPNDRTGVRHMLDDMVNQLEVEARNHHQFNYQKWKIKEIIFDVNSEFTIANAETNVMSLKEKQKISTKIQELFVNPDYREIKSSYRTSIHFQREMLEDAFQIRLKLEQGNK